MKPFRNPFILSLFLPLSTLPTLGQTTYDWTGPTEGSWADSANWNPSSGSPGAIDFVTFSQTNDAPLTINLNGDQSVSGLRTVDSVLVGVHQLLAGGTNRTLTIGAEGIVHLRGGLTIGSATDGQKVDILLSSGQTWDSSRGDGTGNPQAIFINNSVALQAGLGEQTLLLTGSNTGSYIREAISEGAGSVLSIRKTGTDNSIWQLTTDNSYTGTTTIEQGMLRILSGGSIDPTKTTVFGKAILGIRVDGTGNNGLTSAEVANVVLNTTYSGDAVAPSVVQIDHNGTQTISDSLSGNFRMEKTGNGDLYLSGTNAPAHGTTIVTGKVFLTHANALSGPITVNSDRAIVVLAGGSGFTASEIQAFRANLDSSILSNGYFGIDTRNGDFLYDRVLANGDNNTRFVKTGNNTLFLTAENSYQGATRIEAGILSVSDLRSGGQNSHIGRASNVENGLMLAGGRLQYTGGQTAIDRRFNLTASSAIESSGTGALQFTNASSSAASGDANRSLRLTGYNRDDNRMHVAIIDGSTPTRTTEVIKSGFGSWTLNGNNTYTGATTVRGGTLVLDYSNNRTPIAYTGGGTPTGSELLVQNGTAHFTGSSAARIISLKIAEAENGYATIKVSGGMTLTADRLTGTNHSQRHILVDLLGADNKLVVGSLGPSVGRVGSSNLILTNNSTRANIIVRDNLGAYGFAAYNGGEITRLSDQATVTANSPSPVTINSNTTDFILTAGDYNTAGDVIYRTMTLDSSDGVINFNFEAAHTINSNGNGRAWLFTGSEDINLKGTGGGIANSTWFHNYLGPDATLNIESSFGNTGWMIIGGSGFTNYTGTGLATSSSSQSFVLNGGVFRYSPAATHNLNGLHRVSDGIFEIGGKLSNHATLDLNQTSTNFQLFGDSGFSAYGAERRVSLGENLTWGASNFLVDTTNADGDHAFRLSSTRSNATIDVVSNINLNGRMRTVDVAGGEADIDARISGNLTGDGLSNRLVKSGVGTLELTGTNTYGGLTRVDDGRLMIGGGGLSSTTEIHVRNNATLELSAGHHGDLINDLATITLDNGHLISNIHQENMGKLMLIGDNSLDLVGLGNRIRMANSSDVVWSSTLTIYNWNGLLNGGGEDQFFIGTDDSGATTSQLSSIFFSNPEVEGTLFSGVFGATINEFGEIIPVIPEPTSGLLVLLASTGFALRRRRI